jgi:hypothetical protein
MLGATIQALEVQRMTLTTLKTMNVQMNDLRDSLTIRPDGDGADKRAAQKVPAKSAAAKGAKGGAPAAQAVDPMQWWGALTKQFTELAATAMKDSATDAAKNLAGAMLKQSVDAAGQTIKAAAATPGKVVRKAAGVARKRAPAAKRS